MQIEILKWVAGKVEGDDVYDVKAGGLRFEVKFAPIFPWKAGGEFADPNAKVAGILHDQVVQLGGVTFLSTLYGLCREYRAKTPPTLENPKSEAPTDPYFFLLSEEGEPL